MTQCDAETEYLFRTDNDKSVPRNVPHRFAVQRLENTEHGGSALKVFAQGSTCIGKQSHLVWVYCRRKR